MKKEPASEGGLYKCQEGGDELSAWDDGFTRWWEELGSKKRVDCGASWPAVVDFCGTVGGVAGREDGAGTGIWMYRGYFDWVDRVGDWGMDFYAIENWA